MGAANCKEKCDALDISSSPWYAEVEVDKNGCRKFARLPPPGTHPRLFFTEDEIPALIARFKHPKVGDKLMKVLGATVKVFRAFAARVDELSEEERNSPTDGTIRDFFMIDETRNTGLLGTLVWSFIEFDEALMMRVKDMVVFYCRVVTASREFALENEVMEKPFAFWHTKKWDVESPWLAGGSSFALMYDLLFNHMSEDERSIVRHSIALCCKGRKSWGVNWPARRIQSNWAPYNSQIYVMQSAIEDEEGFDDEVHSSYENLMIHYMDFGFHESGHPVEDAYAINLGLREGSYCMLAMARRGLNLFNHPNYKRCFANWLPYALEPQPSGEIYGGSSGSHLMYPTSLMIAKYAFPKDQVIDFVYSKYISPNGVPYIRHTKLQSRLPALFFALPVTNEEKHIDEHAQELNLPLYFSCHNRGKMIMRSDWTEKALWFTLDARPDAFLIGHDSPSRGHFVLHATGRAWGISPEWNAFTEGAHYSLPAIDGMSQKKKAPFVHPLGCKDAGHGSTYAAADLTYAYKWEWTEWAAEGHDLSDEGFEQEPHDPRDFGMTSWWLPQKLYGDRNVAFQGLHQWRRRINDVQYVVRSSLMIRAQKPYMLLFDRVRKDEDEHKYTWTMAIPLDVELVSFDGYDAVLAEKTDQARRLLIRSLGCDGAELECVYETFRSRDGKQEFGRVVFETTAKQADFCFLLYPLADPSEEFPTTELNETDSKLTVQAADGSESQIIAFATGNANEMTMNVVEAQNS